MPSPKGTGPAKRKPPAASTSKAKSTRKKPVAKKPSPEKLTSRRKPTPQPPAPAPVQASSPRASWLHDRRVQIAGVSGALAIILIAAVAAWPDGSTDQSRLTRSSESTSAQEQAAGGRASLPLAESGGQSAPRSVAEDPAVAAAEQEAAQASNRFQNLPIGTGVTQSTISLGLGWSDPASTETVAKAIGTPIKAGPGAKKIAEAVIAYLNARGGIAGRKIVPVWHEHFVPDTASSEGQARDAQAACATFTEDNHVFAFYSNTFIEDTIVKCAIEHKTPMITALSNCGPWLSEQRLAEAGEYFYHLSKFSTQRRERTLVSSLKRQGFFSKGAKVGLLIENSASIVQGANEGLKPALKAAGANVVSEVRYPDFINSPWQNYVLQFQQQGVTHVIFSAARCEPLPVILFTRSAENQQYRPQYGISSDALVGGQMQANTPESQLKNMRGFSMHPNGFGDRYPIQSPSDALCRKIMKGASLPETGGEKVCDFIFFVKFALERAPALSSPGLARAWDKLGTSWVSAAAHTGASRFTPGRHQGIALVRDMKWSAAKKNFDYSSEPYPPR